MRKPDATPPEAANRSIKRRRFAAISRFRPRILTLIVFLVVAAMLVLANLSFDETSVGSERGWPSTIRYRSYGWPIIWHRLVLHFFPRGMGGYYSIVGWYYSAPRLAANLLLWLMLLTVSSGACEWMSRRYRPRLRWSLRTLLVFVAMVAGLFAWYAKARDRAAFQDQIIASSQGELSAERWGPKWLDLLGIDRFRRHIMRAELFYRSTREYNGEGELLQLSRLPDLRSLALEADELTPAAAKTLSGMQQLRTLSVVLDRPTSSLPAALNSLRELRSLSITLGDHTSLGELTADDDDARHVDECLAAIGQMTRLESLSLSVPLRGESLAHLSKIKGLKSLRLDFWVGDWNGSEHRKPDPEGCLRVVGALTQLEWLSLQDLGLPQELRVPNESLAYLAGLSELHTLSLGLATDDHPMLSHLSPLPRLEALDLSGLPINDEDLRRLPVLPRLKLFSLGSLRCTRAGLAELASAESLEEVRLDGESPEHVLALLAFKRLKRLHLGGNQMGVGPRARQEFFTRELMLADGKAIHVYGLEDFQRALAALREANPCIIIDADEMPIFQRMPGGDTPDLGVDADLERPSSWLPGGDVDWMTPLELADFEKKGGHASFYGATWAKGMNLVTTEFDAPRRQE